MKKKTSSIITFLPTEKNKAYLERLGMLDARSGRAKKDGPNISRFINECLTIVCESDKHPRRSIASNDELSAAWRRNVVASCNVEIDRLNQKIQSVIDWKGEK